MKYELREVDPSFLNGRRYTIQNVFELRWHQPENANVRLQQKVEVRIHGDESLNLEFNGNKYIYATVVTWMDVPNT